MMIKAKCPNPVKCSSPNTDKRIITYNNGSDNIDGFPHYHLECTQCGFNFNYWENISLNKLKKSFGEGWENYK